MTEEAQQSCFLTKENSEFEHGLRGFAMNKQHVFFWNNFKIWYFDILEDTHKMNSIGLYVDPNDNDTKVKTVRTCSSTN